ncbi:MAG: RluA family pseudouridine synthase [Deltaproteobacteria bacterium]|nr:RluA family pseudouridine synthase [Deltaproteobacteria bacterium]
MRTFVVDSSAVQLRLDRFVAEHSGVSRGVAMRLIADGLVQVDGRIGKKGAALLAGQTVTVTSEAQDDQSTPPVPQPELPLTVLYEDADVVVVSKPQGMACHPLRAGELGTVASAVVARYPECGEAAQPVREGGVCHRLDTDTSGALIFARTKDAWQKLRSDFAEGLIEKEYLALVVGTPSDDEFDVTLPLLTGRGGSPKMMVATTPEQIYHPAALDAHTCFFVVQRGPAHTLLRVVARTGRRHQIRVHLAHLGLPIVGDPLYGQGEPGGQFLHASRLRFGSPLDPSKRITIEAPLGADRATLLAELLPPHD